LGLLIHFLLTYFEVIIMSIIQTATPKKVATNQATPMAEVNAALKKAVSASTTMFTQCKIAADQAAKQLDASIADIAERVAQIRAIYKPMIGKNHNVSQVFGDALLLHACDQATPISFIKEGKGKEEFQGTPVDAIASLGKNNLKKAASAVRAEMKDGRAKGGGRKPRTPVALVPQVVNHENVMRLVSSQLDADDVAFIKQLTATLAVCGWTLTKAK
jgi:hypothetical protein